MFFWVFPPSFGDYVAIFQTQPCFLTDLAVSSVPVGLAAAIPKLDLFISLVGAASSSTLALLAPSFIDTVLFWPDTGRFHFR